MSKRANFFAIGIFVITAFILTVSIVIVFGSGVFTKRTATLVSTFRGSTNGLREGAKVKAYGVEVGLVDKIMLHRIMDTGEVVIPILIEINLNHVGNLLGFRSLTESDVEFCMNVLENDSHATLQMESFLTGMLYVEMVFGRDEEGYILDSPRFAGYRAIPSAPTQMEIMKQSLQSLAMNLGQSDVRGLIEETRGALVDIRQHLENLHIPTIESNLNSLLTDLRAKVNNPGIDSAINDLSEGLASFNSVMSNQAGGSLERFDTTLEQLSVTLTEIGEVVKDAQTWLDPSNSIYQEMIRTLDEIGDASRSLRVLADYLERNPNALISGKSRQEVNP
jgi:paraquat-inducible protein B